MLLLWLFMCLVYGYGCGRAAQDLGIHWSISIGIAAIVPLVLECHFFKGV